MERIELVSTDFIPSVDSWKEIKKRATWCMNRRLRWCSADSMIVLPNGKLLLLVCGQSESMRAIASALAMEHDGTCSVVDNAWTDNMKSLAWQMETAARDLATEHDVIYIETATGARSPSTIASSLPPYFSRLTINVNRATIPHRDPKNEGTCAMTIVYGDSSGGELCYPEWGIAVKAEEGDVLIADLHEVHGNLPLHGLGRRSFILFHR